MSILIDENKRVLIQGITGREGSVRTKLMKEYGTQVVAGVTPGKKGQEVHGIPVFDTVEEAWERVGPIDVSVVFVPAPLVRNTALEAIESGIQLVVLVPDRVPLYDTLEIAEYAEKNGARFVGPNTLGLISPGKAVLGMIGGRVESAKEWFRPGNVGVISRSGGMTSAISYYLTRSGMGESTIIHVGGDAVVGMRQADVLKEFQEDDETEVVVLFGEIGTTQEEEVAELIQKKCFTKPLVAFISGAAAKTGTRFSHAGAIVEGSRGSYKTKVKTLQEAGVYVVSAFNDIFTTTRQLLTEKV